METIAKRGEIKKEMFGVPVLNDISIMNRGVDDMDIEQSNLQLVKKEEVLPVSCDIVIKVVDNVLMYPVISAIQGVVTHAIVLEALQKTVDVYRISVFEQHVS